MPPEVAGFNRPAHPTVDPELIRPEVCRRIRTCVGWTQTRFGDLTHLDRTTISKAERGRRRLGPEARRRYLAGLAVLALGFTIAALDD